MVKQWKHLVLDIISFGLCTRQPGSSFRKRITSFAIGAVIGHYITFVIWSDIEVGDFSDRFYASFIIFMRCRTTLHYFFITIDFSPIRTRLYLALEYMAGRGRVPPFWKWLLKYRRILWSSAGVLHKKDVRIAFAQGVRIPQISYKIILHLCSEHCVLRTWERFIHPIYLPTNLVSGVRLSFIGSLAL